MEVDTSVTRSGLSEHRFSPVHVPRAERWDRSRNHADARPRGGNVRVIGSATAHRWIRATGAGWVAEKRSP
jgi:hypothetical protein